jgi:hypothetical protein
MNDSTLEVANGTYDVGTHNLTWFLITLKCTNVAFPAVLNPTYTNEGNAWLYIKSTNVTISGVIIHHTYNYSGWTNDLINSAPLFFISSSSYVKLSQITFTTSDTSLVGNPVIVGSDGDSVVDIENCTFTKINLRRVTLIYVHSSATFNITNVKFGYSLLYAFILYFIFLFFLGTVIYQTRSTATGRCMRLLLALRAVTCVWGTAQWRT